MQGRRLRKKDMKSAALQVGAVILGIILIIPILYAVSVSMMTETEMYKTPVSLLPESLNVQNYIKAWVTTNISRYLLNSFIIAVSSSIIRILLCSSAAFAFSFFEFKGKTFLFFLVLSTMLMPSDVLVLSNYQTISSMGLVNTYLGVIVVFMTSAVNIFLFRQHFLGFSAELHEAAMLDGCGNIKFYSKILIPSTKPIIVTVFISTFIGVWNQYIWPMIATTDDNMRTVQVGVKIFRLIEGHDYGPMMAASTIALIPTIFIFIIFQKRIVSGIMGGAIKG